MKHRKLRIAWSAAWGVAAVLLIALWIRSYWRSDLVGYGSTRFTYYVSDGRNLITFGRALNPASLPVLTWDIQINSEIDSRFNSVSERPFYHGMLGFGLTQRLPFVLDISFPFAFPVLGAIAMALALGLPQFNRFSYVGACQV